MSKPINDGGPAFPHNVDAIHHGTAGLSLRDYFAAKSMAALLNPSDGDRMSDRFAKVIAIESYKMADEMLKASGR